MNFLRRKPKLPAALRPALAPDERVVAWAPVDDDKALVATNQGLWLPEGKRLGWHEIHKAAWSGRELRITPAEIAEERPEYTVLVDGPIAVFLLLEPGELPDQVRTRVTRSVGYTTHHPLTAGGVRVVGRRVSGRNGLSWAVRYDAGTPVQLSTVTELTDELVSAARSATMPVD
ncbi:hypothetical protein [Paractinoplanes rishiriensis]|uniref:Uncharacterized protein n=1 Tax=Paractinoplanes rishiriensis TaxID=1050105 RepID=A0A919K4Q9_9ACTN|nr:hypothetical protein [Actinoplanes rishiriensis]GIF00139.1 hypothetical protein Ari01nite_76030 [Actinoplanes rishiriensis]